MTGDRGRGLRDWGIAELRGFTEAATAGQRPLGETRGRGRSGALVPGGCGSGSSWPCLTDSGLTLVGFCGIAAWWSRVNRPASREARGSAVWTSAMGKKWLLVGVELRYV